MIKALFIASLLFGFQAFADEPISDNEITRLSSVIFDGKNLEVTYGHSGCSSPKDEVIVLLSEDFKEARVRIFLKDPPGYCTGFFTKIARANVADLIAEACKKSSNPEECNDHYPNIILPVVSLKK